MHKGTKLIICCFLLVQQVFTTPNLGIRPDHLEPTGADTDKDIQSYSSIIKFDDPSIPLDKTKMTDAKLLHLCVSAYNDMVNIYKGRNLRPEALPRAMAAMAYKDKIYFASSVRATRYMIDLNYVHGGSVRAIMDACAWMGLGTHQNGGGCAELNSIELFWTDNGMRDPDKNPAPRIVIWALPRHRAIDTNSERNTRPCRSQGEGSTGYGCHDILLSYGIEAIDSNVAPDSTGEDDWRFSLEPNPRPPCQRAKA